MWHKVSALEMLCITSKRNLNSEERKTKWSQRVCAHLWFVEPRLCMGLFPVGFATAFGKISMQLRQDATKKTRTMIWTMIPLQGQPVSDMFRRWWCLESVKSLVFFSSGLLVAFLCSTQLLIYVEISLMTSSHSVNLVKVEITDDSRPWEGWILRS